jgi:DNA repair protein RadB
MKIPMPPPLNDVIPHVSEKALTSFYGGPGTGKTCLALLAAIECVRNKGKVVYVDTEGGFSVERIRQLLDNRMATDSFLKSVDLIQPKTFEEQGKAIDSLADRDFDLLIVDSLVALYRLEYSNQDEILAASRKLSKQLSSLAAIAREKNVPVVLTAHTYRNWDTGENEMVGGETLKYWSKAIVFLEKTGRMSERKATLAKHQHHPEGREAKFMLVEKGIAPVKFKLF